MKKLCIVAATGLPINFFMLKHIKYLSEYYDVTVVIGDNILLRDKTVKTKKIVMDRKINIFQDLKSLYNLYAFFNKEEFDVVLSIAPKAGLLAMLASLSSGINVRIHFFTGQVWATKKGLLKYVLKKMDKIIVVASSHILIDSISQRTFLENQNILNTKRKNTVLKCGSISGVDTDKFKLNLSLKKELKEQYSLKDETVFMFVGRLNKDKGILDIVNVFNVLFELYPEKIKLFLVGSAEDDIEDDITQFLKHDNVTRIGYVSYPERILNLADILVLPSYREGFGTVVIEAAAMKIPTIGSNIYGLNDAILNNKSGLLHRKGDIKDMLEKYTYIIENSGKIKDYGEFAFNRVVKDFIDNDLSLALVDYILKIDKS